jgi:hypothetical protein
VRDEALTAEIDRIVLLEALDAAEKSIKSQLVELEAEMEASVQKLMKQVHFFSRRPYSRKEAEAYLYNNCWDWDEWLKEHRVKDKLARIQRLAEIVSSNKLTHIRLSDDCLYLLRNYL